MYRIIEYLHDFNYATVVLRLILAVIIGGIIGNERGKHGSAAGLRTHILVCIGSAMTSLTSCYVYYTLWLSGDVFRIPAQVISGIGFLGAGIIIIKNSNIVTGLTTAAGMWATAAIGVAVGFGFYSGAFAATVFCVFTAAFLTRLERKRKTTVHVYVEVDLSKDINSVTNAIHNDIDPESVIETVTPKSNVPNTIGMYVMIADPQFADKIKEKIDKIEGVRFSVLE